MRNKLINAITFLFCLGIAQINFAQNVGINTTGASPDNSAMLDIVSSDKGLLIPRMDSTSRKNIVIPAQGLMVFDSTYNSFYFYDGITWTSVGTDNQDLSLSGNSLSLTNDGTPVDLSSYLDADNLGNHTATQNIKLDGNWLNHNGAAGAGIYVDAPGNVGIKMRPSGNFHVRMGVDGFSTLVYNHLSGTEIVSYNLWQSFTPSADGYLNSARMPRGIPTGGAFNNWSFNVHEGEGTAGKIIHTGVTSYEGIGDYFLFHLGNTIVKKEEKYTLAMYNPAYSASPAASSSNPYPGGRLNVSANHDLNMSLYIQEFSPGFVVSDNGVLINDYTLPNADGAADQVLSTDGMGTVNWVDKTANTDNQQLTISNDSLFLTNDATAISLSPYLDNTDNQQLTISNDSLFLTNDASAINLNPYLDNTDNQQLILSGNNLSLTDGGTPINLNPYLDADNLGNHTASQDIIIGSNAIQNNSSSANGMSMGSENQLLVESNFQRSGYFTTTGVNALNQSFGNYLEVNNKYGTRSLFGADGDSFYSLDTLNTVMGNWTPGGGITFHVSAGVKVMTLDALGNLGVGRIAATNRLEVEGDASKTTAGNWIANSDARLKKNINSLSSEIILEKMLSLQGVTYEWNDNKTNTKRPEGIQYGFTAQNIQAVFPTLVTEDNNGFFQTPYGTYDAMTVEAIRALNDKIENLSRELVELEIENKTLKAQNEGTQSQLAEMDELKSEVQAIKLLLKNSAKNVSFPSMDSKK